jgi:cation transport ATPase
VLHLETHGTPLMSGVHRKEHDTNQSRNDHKDSLKQFSQIHLSFCFAFTKLTTRVRCIVCFLQSVMGAMLKVHLKSANIMPNNYALFVVVLVCLFVSGFAWSWGPLGWLIPSEIFPLETRSAGFFFAVSMNMFCTFVVAQSFLTLLCQMKSTIFFFFAACIVVMGAFAIFILPETKGIHIDEMNERVWKKHWFWKRYFDDGDNDKGDQDIKADQPEKQ